MSEQSSRRYQVGNHTLILRLLQYAHPFRDFVCARRGLNGRNSCLESMVSGMPSYATQVYPRAVLCVSDIVLNGEEVDA